MSKKEISAAEFGADPNKENNATELRNAVRACSGQTGLTLVIPPGIYHFSDEEAIEMRDTQMRGQFGGAFERMMFFPYAPYVKGLDFTGCEDLTVEAAGVTLLCHGWMEPISLENCNKITLNGITIDYEPKPFSVGKIVQRNEDSYDIEIDPAYPITPDTPCSRTLFWNATENHLVKASVWPSKESIDTQKVRFKGAPPTEQGEILAMITHSLHFRPAILIHEAKEITLNDVTIHAQPGMGIVGNRGHNITFNHLKIVPSPGLHFSTNTDATHFTACTGTLVFDHCRIEGQPDDSTNVHSYYHTIIKREVSEVGDIVHLRVDAPTGTHSQVLDYPNVGDELELVEIETLKTVCSYRATAVERKPDEWRNIVTLDGHLPEDYQRYNLVDVTTVPQLIIRNSHFINSFSRILIKSRGVLIENNVMENVFGCGVSVCAEEGWKEGITPHDVTIRNNKFLHCGIAIDVGVSAKNTTTVGLNKRITIENNQIESDPGQGGIQIRCAEDVLIKGNQIRGCHPGIKIEYSTRVKILNNPNCEIEKGTGFSD